ncbi:MAG: radical SAM family heme chaperone HemW [Candidatus Dormibacteraceae bacterium]
MAALERELGWAAERYRFGSLRTIYFGGGTPSLVPPETIASLLARVRDRFGIDADAEITLEANPVSTDAGRLAAWRRAGVNRLSLGVQGFDPVALAVLERRTDGAQAERAVGLARAAGFANLSLDLIYAVPFQSLDSWQATLETAIRLEPEHLSCYCLTFEEGTPLHRRLTKGLLPEVDADRQWEFLERCRSVLTGAGFRRYEVSSWTRPGFESKHNQSYWQCRPVYGAGCGAHSYTPLESGSRRWWNVSRPPAYISSDSYEADGETLGPRQTAAETLMLGLRSAQGMKPPAGFETALELLQRAGLIAWDEGRAHPTERGLDLHNQIALAIL